MFSVVEESLSMANTQQRPRIAKLKSEQAHSTAIFRSGRAVFREFVRKFAVTIGLAGSEYANEKMGSPG
jgi:hypothetical protein